MVIFEGQLEDYHVDPCQLRNTHRFDESAQDIHLILVDAFADQMKEVETKVKDLIVRKEPLRSKASHQL